MSTDSILSGRGLVIDKPLRVTAAPLSPRQFSAGERRGRDGGIVGMMWREAATAQVTIQRLRGGISVLMGGGGNIAVLAGSDGKLLVDSGIAAAQPQIAEALATVGASPVRHVINTHWHFDHTDGNEWLHSEGAVILAHENCRKRLSESTRVEAWGFTFDPSPAAALPVVNFNAGLTLHLHNASICVEAYGPAHTDSDLLVEFKEADVVHLGDTWWNGRYPFIDCSTGGSIDGMIRATDTNLSRVTAKTIIIPGHGPIGDKAQLTEYRDMLTAVRERIAMLKKQGQSLAEVLAAKPTLKHDAKFGHALMSPDFFAELVYAGA